MKAKRCLSSTASYVQKMSLIPMQHSLRSTSGGFHSVTAQMEGSFSTTSSKASVPMYTSCTLSKMAELRPLSREHFCGIRETDSTSRTASHREKWLCTFLLTGWTAVLRSVTVPQKLHGTARLYKVIYCKNRATCFIRTYSYGVTVIQFSRFMPPVAVTE